MSNTNSKNLKFIIFMMLVLFFVFTYMCVYNNYDKTIYTNIKEIGNR